MLLGEERGAFLREHIGTGKRVLDIGCRDGALTGTYCEGNSVLGVDIDSEALKRAQESLGIETRYIDLNGNWALPKNSFDAVVAAEVLEHLYYPLQVTEKVSAVLNKDGIFLGTIPNAFSIKHRIRYLLLKKKGTPMEDPTHINHFTVKEIKNILETYFEHVTVHGIGRYATLARIFPQLFAFDLLFAARVPKS